MKFSARFVCILLLGILLNVTFLTEGGRSDVRGALVKVQRVLRHVADLTSTLRRLRVVLAELKNQTERDVTKSLSSDAVQGASKAVVATGNILVTEGSKSAKQFPDMANKMVAAATKFESCGSLVCKKTVVPKLNEDGQIQLPYKAGRLVTNCGNKQFLLSKKKMTAAEAFQFCCSYGMITATVSKEEISCLQNSYNNRGSFNKASTNFLDHIYTTAYFDDNLDRRFVSCVTLEAMPDTLWSKGQPDNQNKTEQCTGLGLKHAGGGGAGVMDVSCTYDFPVLCEITSKKTVTKAPVEDDGKSKKYYSEIVAVVIAVSSDKCGNLLCSQTPIPKFNGKVAANNGFLVTCGKKQFLLTKKKVTAFDAFQHCCTLGMVTATVVKEDLTCLQNAYNNRGSFNKASLNVRDHIYITAYFDMSLDRHFVSCVTMEAMPDTLWAVGDPDNRLSIEPFVGLALHHAGSQGGFMDISGVINYYVICEVKL